MVRSSSFQDWLHKPHRGHAVAYYTSEDKLVKSLFIYVDSAVSAKERCLIITRPSVAKRLHRALRGQQIPDAYYSIMDADAVLEEFMMDGMPDKRKFFQKLDSIVQNNRSASGSVRIYGDMVARLWEDGNKKAVLALEELWKEFVQTRAFPLYCAYPERLFEVENRKEQATIDATHDISAVLR